MVSQLLPSMGPHQQKKKHLRSCLIFQSYRTATTFLADPEALTRALKKNFTGYQRSCSKPTSFRSPSQSMSWFHFKLCFSVLPRNLSPLRNPSKSKRVWFHPHLPRLLYHRQFGLPASQSRRDQNKSSFVDMSVSLNGGFSQNTPKWSFLVGKPMVVGETHRKPLYVPIHGIGDRYCVNSYRILSINLIQLYIVVSIN